MGLPENSLDADYDFFDDRRALLGLFAGVIRILRGVRGVFRDFQHRRVHLFHGGDRPLDTARLLLRPPARLLDLGGKLFRCRRQNLDDSFQFIGRLQQALGLLFRNRLRLFGLEHGLGGLFFFPECGLFLFEQMGILFF